MLIDRLHLESHSLGGNLYIFIQRLFALLIGQYIKQIMSGMYRSYPKYPDRKCLSTQYSPNTLIALIREYIIWAV